MSDLSDDHHGASWLMGLEFALWDDMRREPGPRVITPDEAQRLRAMSESCAGWVVFDDDEGTERFVTLAEWAEIYAEGPTL